jgi:tight adherence protein C
MPANGTVTLTAFLAASSLVLMVSLALGERRGRLESRLKELAGKGEAGPTAPDRSSITRLAETTLPKIGTPFVPSDEDERTRLQTRLIHAGLYGRQAMVVFLGLKVFLMFAPAALGAVAGTLGLVAMQTGLLVGACCGILGMIGPSFWLDQKKSKRQASFRRALPDALDLLVICLEGGLSLTGALRRMGGELRTAHPMLAAELHIVQREVQLGRTTGDALRKMGERADLEEIRGLASVIIQAEKYGASLVYSLRVHSEMLRVKRMQQAEEKAQQAATKVLFPTVLFILPAMFVVILGPALIHVSRILGRLGA